jgi:hypothetical protein
MVFPRRAALQENLSAAVPNDDRERAVQRAVPMRRHFSGGPRRTIVGIHQNDLLGFRPLIELHRSLQSVTFR